MQITLWIEADDTDDLDLFVGVEKWAAGRYVPFEGSYGLAATASRLDGSACHSAASMRRRRSLISLDHFRQESALARAVRHAHASRERSSVGARVPLALARTR
jgi:hypothetical protein